MALVLQPGYAHDFGSGFRQTAQIEKGELRCSICRRKLMRGTVFFSAADVQKHYAAKHGVR